jgi:hypothetical protein
MDAMQAKIVHVTIRRPWREVYDFAADPRNMPQWATGLTSGFTPDGEDWIADGGPIGKVRVRFAPPNSLGVIDHEVILENGTRVWNSFRIVPNGDGAEAMFTLLRQPEMDDAAFAADAAHVRKDLETLKRLMEER